MSTFLLRLRDVRFPLRTGETLLGRSPYSSVVLEDPRVSREHAAIRLTSAGPIIEDLASRNGTQVNGIPLRGKLLLSPGDVIVLGSQTLVLEAHHQVELGLRKPVASTGDYPATQTDGESPTEPGTTLSRTGTTMKALLARHSPSPRRPKSAPRQR